MDRWAKRMCVTQHVFMWLWSSELRICGPLRTGIAQIYVIQLRTAKFLICGNLISQCVMVTTRCSYPGRTGVQPYPIIQVLLLVGCKVRLSSWTRLVWWNIWWQCHEHGVKWLCWEGTRVWIRFGGWVSLVSATSPCCQWFKTRENTNRFRLRGQIPGYMFERPMFSGTWHYQHIDTRALAFPSVQICCHGGYWENVFASACSTSWQKCTPVPTVWAWKINWIPNGMSHFRRYLVLEHQHFRIASNCEKSARARTYKKRFSMRFSWTIH